MHNYTEFVAGLGSPKTRESQMNMLNTTALGLAGELGELKEAVTLGEEKILDEGGDFMWYITLGYIALGETFTNFVTCDPETVLWGENASPTYLVGDFVNHVKKHVFHEKDIDWNKAINQLNRIMAWFQIFLKGQNLTLQNVIDNNYVKLKDRYPGGFDTNRAPAV